MCSFNNILHFSGLPYGEPQCFAYATRNNEYLMLSCSWEGGVPRALLWWVSSLGDIQGSSEENSNILVLRSSANYSGKAFICHAKHPLAKDSKQCVLKLGKIKGQFKKKTKTKQWYRKSCSTPGFKLIT